MSQSVPAWEVPALPVKGGGSYRVRRGFCVGRNYAEHAREMGHDPEREPPFFFAKAADAVTAADSVPYPPRTDDLHHEIELVVAIGGGGRDIAVADAKAHIFGYAVGIDLTRRDLQAEAKRLSRPWYLAKSWVGAAPTGPIVPAAEIGHPRAGRIWLDVDGEPRQDADLRTMIWSVDEVVAHLSTYDALLPGDLIYTGTPAGVGPVAPGATMHGGVAGVGEITVRVAA